MNKYFTNQTIIRESNVELPTTTLNDNRTVLLNIEIIPSEVKDVLQSLKLGKSSGPDGINNRLL